VLEGIWELDLVVVVVDEEEDEEENEEGNDTFENDNGCVVNEEEDEEEDEEGVEKLNGCVVVDVTVDDCIGPYNTNGSNIPVFAVCVDGVRCIV